MPDLLDGEVIEVRGSAQRPYQIKNLAGLYSCSCPAWRNQSLPIDRRSCKHIRRVRGDEAEAVRIGSQMSSSPQLKAPKFVPPVLLAETWNENIDPTDYWASEKLDGMRAWWSGTALYSRNGNRIHAPDWFIKGLPLVPLDGELWLGRKQFQRTVSIVRRQDAADLWKAIRFVVFDAPAEEGDFESRMAIVRLIMEQNQPLFARMHTHERCRGTHHLHNLLAFFNDRGGEGVMLRKPGSKYEVGRSDTLLKVKRFHDAEAQVAGHQSGTGRHQGRLGALLVKLPNGTSFAVGTGFTDAERENPPAIGSTITFKYQELSDGGVPRFPSYVGVRADAPLSIFQGDQIMSEAKKRRFEFVEGTSNKFWECQVSGKEVHVQFGRIGTGGQTLSKSFPNESSAAEHATKEAAKKLAKGYIEVAA